MNVYLDWAATAVPEKKIIIDAAERACEFFGNPSSVHDEGRRARAFLDNARTVCGAALGVPAETVFFNAGGTEGNQAVLTAAMLYPAQAEIAVSSIEHASVLRQADALLETGRCVHRIAANADGIIEADSVRSCLNEQTKLVAVMAVNNETGAIQPIADIANVIRNFSHGRRHIHFHVDAVQAAGKIPVDFTHLDADSVAISGHKIGAPRGIGIVLLRKHIMPFLRGGGQEDGMRSGTENLLGAAALADCLTRTYRTFDEHFGHARACMQRCIIGLRRIKGVRIIPDSRTADDSRFSPWIVQFAAADVSAETLVRVLSDAGIFISTGSACSLKKKTRSVLEAMGLPPNIRRSAARISIGYTTTQADIDAALKKIEEACGCLRGNPQ